MEQPRVQQQAQPPRQQQQAQQRQSAPTSTEQAQQRQSAPMSSAQGQSRQHVLPGPLQSAVQQLSQQRDSVVQAVQARAQRAIHGAPRGDTPSSDDGTNPFAPTTSPPPLSPGMVQSSDSDGQGSWSVMRISEVLHRRFVAPMMGQSSSANVVEHGTVAAMTTPWQSPPTTTPAQTPLMSPEVRQAMSSWTAQPSLITRPVGQGQGQRDDSSSASLPQELILEEVRRQVQQAMVERDSEVKDSRAQNEELKTALHSSAQLLNEVMTAGGCGGGGPPSLQALREPPGLEPGGNLRGSDRGANVPPEAPPGEEGSSSVFGSNPWLRGRAEGPTCGAASGLPDRSGVQGGNPVNGGSMKQGVPQFGPLEDSRMREAEDGGQGSPLELLIQGMRQLQQVYMDKRTSGEAENLKGVSELAPLPELGGDTGVEFSDWLYVAEQAIGAMSDSASLWFERTLGAAREAYARYQIASPLERLAIAPRVAPELLEPKWVRLDRKVMTLVLSAMPKMVKEDAVTHRVTSVAMALYRLHVLYSPGGTAERAAILKHLEGASAGESIPEVIAALRKWRRFLTRSAEMQLTAPDPSILLRGVETIIAACVQKHGEMSFRLSLARNELQLQNRPTNETVLRFYDHALAEMQQALPAKWATKPGEPPRIKAIGAGTGEASSTSSPTASPNKGTRGAASTTPCKFFLSEAGCRRGQQCKYHHEFANRDEKRSRCWTRGSKQHRQSECPTRDGTKNAKDKPGGGNNGPKAAAIAAGPPLHEPKATTPTPSPTATPTTATTSSMANGEAAQSVVQAEPNPRSFKRL